MPPIAHLETLKRRHYILLPFGSSGDVNPFLWIARHLRERGHAVTLVLSPPFDDAARSMGLDYVAVGERRHYEEVLSDPDLWHPRRAANLVMKFAGDAIPVHVDAIQMAAAGATLPSVLVGGTLAFGTRLAREKLQLPLATVHLQPSVFTSLHDTPVLFAGWEWFSRMPVWFKRIVFSLPDPFDRIVGPKARAACIREGVPPPKRIWPGWFHSPDLVLGLFPAWFAAPQIDWPANHRLIGFPLHDLGDRHGLPADIAALLADGEPPVLFTPGSAMAHGKTFFATGLAACGEIGTRALLVSPFRDQIPKPLPPWAFHVDHVPFSRILPGVSVFVHHGGIGTLSQGLAAGKPQLIMPMAHDQPDNARRLIRLGAGRMLYPKRFTPDRVAEALRSLLSDAAVQTACATSRKLAQSGNPREALLHALESLPVEAQSDKTQSNR